MFAGRGRDAGIKIGCHAAVWTWAAVRDCLTGKRARYSVPPKSCMNSSKSSLSFGLKSSRCSVMTTTE